MAAAHDRRQALTSLIELLTLFGVANDAEDHGSGREAVELRERATTGIRALAARHPVVHRLIPDLSDVLDRELLVFTWPTAVARVEAELAEQVRAQKERGES